MVHVDEQPSPETVLPSSQNSISFLIPSPHTGCVAFTHAPPTPPAFGHVYPGSVDLQSAAQPSPATVLPSSHASLPVTFRSPQTIVETHNCPGVGQTKFGSRLHKPVQPSPGVVLPSSHSSVPLRIPS